MPNHYTTVGLCARGDYDIEFDVIKSGLEGKDLCELVLPMPDALKGIIHSYPKSYRYVSKATGEPWTQDCNGPDDRSAFDEVEIADSEKYSLLRDHGATNWYDWRINNHGTKWGTYDLKVYELGGDGAPILIEFQTAWGPPNPDTMSKINEYLFNEFKLTGIRWLGYNPSDDSISDVEAITGAKR